MPVTLYKIVYKIHEETNKSWTSYIILRMTSIVLPVGKHKRKTWKYYFTVHRRVLPVKDIMDGGHCGHGHTIVVIDDFDVRELHKIQTVCRYYW